MTADDEEGDEEGDDVADKDEEVTVADKDEEVMAADKDEEKEDEEAPKSYEGFHFIINLSSYFSYYNRYVNKIR